MRETENERERHYTVQLHFQQFIKFARKLAQLSICANTNTQTHTHSSVVVFVFVFVAKRGKNFLLQVCLLCKEGGVYQGVARNSIEILLK